MAYQKKGQQDKAYIADSLEDLDKIPLCGMGSTVWVIETAEKYMINSKGEWILQTISTNSTQQYATVEQMREMGKTIVRYSDSKDKEILKEIDLVEEE